MIYAYSFSRSNEEVDYYIEKLSSLSEKYELYVDLRRWRRAAEIASIARDVDKLHDVSRQCNDPSLQAQIIDIIQRIH
jgi:hypothetical protein